MNGVIFYYSNTGNTKLACQYIIRKLTAITWNLVDITRNDACSVDQFDIVGFAASADYFSPSPIFKTFVGNLPVLKNKPAFVFNTFGNFNGATLRIMAKLVSSRGFRVVTGHALHTPENIATMIMMGLANTQAPNDKELESFNSFIADLDRIVQSLQNDAPIAKLNRFSLPFADGIIPPLPRLMSKLQMGKKMVDSSICTKCKKCASICPYNAVSFTDRPVFDEKRCKYCWRCYNLCPTKAIYTKKFKGVGHYPEPIKNLVEKLGDNR